MNSHAGAGLPQAVPLSVAGLRAACGGPASLWRDIRVVDETGSTNEDALRCAKDGAPEGLVIAAETQTAGKGRQGRRWVSLPGSALTFSVLIRPRSVPQSARGWVPLLAGLAAATAVRSVTSVDATLKWPNDILVGSGKLAGILAEQSGEAIVVGIGINVLGQTGNGEHDLPVATAISLQAYGAAGLDRTELLAAILREFERCYLRWSVASGDAEGCGLRREYLRLSATVGSRVRVELPGGRVLAGTATDVDDTGRLLVRPADGNVQAVSAGDVVHVRLPATPCAGAAPFCLVSCHDVTCGWCGHVGRGRAACPAAAQARQDAGAASRHLAADPGGGQRGDCRSAAKRGSRVADQGCDWSCRPSRRRGVDRRPVHALADHHL
jgi:BirA family transcriptional regulator, biotin operon repressor / biotin---[acetyl-CoA-carboxylase] ligase